MLAERPVNRAEVLLNARIIGGFRMIDGGEADDKVIAVLHPDPLWDDVHDIGDAPKVLIDRMRHYFLTYKLRPGEEADVSIEQTYGREHALRVIEASRADYQEAFGD